MIKFQHLDRFPRDLPFSLNGCLYPYSLPLVLVVEHTQVVPGQQYGLTTMNRAKEEITFLPPETSRVTAGTATDRRLGSLVFVVDVIHPRTPHRFKEILRGGPQAIEKRSHTAPPLSYRCHFR